MIYEIIDTRTGERANASALVQEPWAEKVRCLTRSAAMGAAGKADTRSVPVAAGTQT